MNKIKFQPAILGSKLLAQCLFLSALVLLIPNKILAQKENQVKYKIQTIAGGGQSIKNNVLAISALLNNPKGICVDSSGNIYIADTSETGDSAVSKINTKGILTIVAGSGEKGYSGDGGKATLAKLAFACRVAVDISGDIYIADSGNNRIRKVNPAGIITTIAGNGRKGYSGDGGKAISAELNWPDAIAFDKLGNIFIVDSFNCSVRKIDKNGIITTIAGNGKKGYSGDNGPATSAELKIPRGIVLDSSNNIYISDTGNHRIRKVDGNGIITSIAGMGQRGYSGDGGTALLAQFSYPEGIAIDASGNLYIVDSFNDCIRKIDKNGIITTIAGKGAPGADNDLSNLNAPWDLTVDSNGNIYVADSGNNVIKKLSTVKTGK